MNTQYYHIRLGILCLFWLLTFQFIFAQHKTENRSMAIKIMPFSVLDNTPRYRLGLDYISGKRLGYGLDIGYGNSPLNGWRGESNWGDDFSVYEIRPELKYILKSDKRFNFYLALELFFINLDVNLKNKEYYPEDSSSLIGFERADLQRYKLGFHIKAGCNIITQKRFNIDLYYGLGFASRTVEYSNIENPSEIPFGEVGGWLIPQSQYNEGTNSLFHIAIGLKFGYILWWDKNHKSRLKNNKSNTK